MAYLITFRTYATWLHGDDRHSVDRHGRHIYGTPDIPPNENLRNKRKSAMKSAKFILSAIQRSTVDLAIRALCKKRGYNLRAINVRTNHVHIVVSATARPERIADAFKASSTIRLREENLIDQDVKIWSRGRSRRYLWKPRHVELAIAYVLYGQGDDLFKYRFQGHHMQNPARSKGPLVEMQQSNHQRLPIPPYLFEITTWSLTSCVFLQACFCMPASAAEAFRNIDFNDATYAEPRTE